MSSPFLWRVWQTSKLEFRLSFYRENECPSQITGKGLQRYICSEQANIPSFQITQPVDENIKIYGVWGIEIVFIIECSLRCFYIQGFVE